MALNKDNIEQISISKSLANLTSAHENDSTWIPKILMEIPSQYETNVATLNSNDDNNQIDIIPYTVKPSIESRTIYEKCLNYPKDCTFYFQGYDGIHYVDKLKKDIINATSKDGTFLKVDINDHYTARGNK